MSIKKKVCLMLLLVCCLPSLAFAKSYKCMDIYENKISTSDIVFSAGDKITGGRMSGINGPAVISSIKCF